jgi:hypothetical protein
MKLVRLTLSSYNTILIATDKIESIEHDDSGLGWVIIRTASNVYHVEQPVERVIALLEEANDEGPGLPGPMLSGGTLETRLSG